MRVFADRTGVVCCWPEKGEQIFGEIVIIKEHRRFSDVERVKRLPG